MPSSTCDYIVVGSGSAGGVVAGRLSENGKYSVLCLEAGTKGANHLWSRTPAGTIFMIDKPALNWCYHSEPDVSHGNRAIYVPRGKMLGGSSSINGMTYNRGQRNDYDTWAQMGCRGWSFDEVLPYLKKMESSDIGSDEYRGREGPMKVTEAVKISPFYDLFIKSAVSAGVPFNPDYSGATQEGVAMAQQNIYRGVRQSTVTQYLEPACRRPNFRLLCGAEVVSLILKGKQCVGVRFRRRGKLCEARAKREVIIACGAANSPKLLELSGIGNPEILARHGIPVMHELKGVGENLRDHYGALIRWSFNRPGISIAKQGHGLGLAREILRYILFRQGFISQGVGTLRVFMRSRPGLERPDIMMVVAAYMIEMTKAGKPRMSPAEGFFMWSHLQRTESTGHIHIKTEDPTQPPSINFRFLSTPNDRLTAILAVRRARDIVGRPPLVGMIGEELQPGRAVESDEDILAYLRDSGQITHHMVGTCKMGHDPMSVVDDRLRVHGISGLRVADASIMPTMLSGNTSAPCMMIGEKCADMVLADGANQARESSAF